MERETAQKLWDAIIEAGMPCSLTAIAESDGLTYEVSVPATARNVDFVKLTAIAANQGLRPHPRMESKRVVFVTDSGRVPRR